MAADLGPLIAKVQAMRAVDESALAFINGIAERIQAAVDAALANGATAEQLAPVQAEVDATVATSEAVAAAIVANTPASARRS